MHAQFSNYFQGILNKFSLSIHPKKKFCKKRRKSLSGRGSKRRKRYKSGKD
jgi:hypothetical protein